MKRILITGANSYIGTSFEKWVAQWPEEYHVDSVDTKNGEWKELDFSPYDTIFHVAGIAHQDAKADQEELYYKVNRDLTIEVAQKAKSEGVKQFIFMSSMIVYGASSKIGETKVITRDTVPEPINFYGNSKLQAEQGILPLQSEGFNVVVIRPPMIYGKDSKGNYPFLAKFAKITPLFPDIDNKRSMLHIDNLTELIRLLVSTNEHGVFFPQNKEYVKTSEMVKTIADISGKKMKLVKLFNPILYLLSNKIGLINKVFGDLNYDMSLSDLKHDYRIKDLKKSIISTEVES
ncbi:NAD-dependent epimerase/dehydratase family protein [Trichococcus sp. K1Tr]|uniref:NAD-dependent epimerase/dehydratase family protein n=1 Tax=Trichococcus sp. K1Tr TaxID=3020847 RepID=UPI00232C2DEE|nr:NAD-dependent epimerase/dehydratase family protein [Trichococcus sp. K1Tr]MDB6353562.1 NAD-dependent epimerase/dehydratase family protein [Trichococcus sp. K1Tr]